MLNEVICLLDPKRGGIFVDGTLGGGGHSLEVLKRLPSGSKLYGIDRDEAAIMAASSRLKRFMPAFEAIRGNFFDMKQILAQRGVFGVDGILLDLGVSSYQLDLAERGFSYHDEAPLDMRMDSDAALCAYDVVNGYSEAELTRIIKEYGEERFASKVAKRIVNERKERPIATTTQLSNIIKSALGAAAYKEAQHPARRTFQAIRIEVNGELNGLEQAIDDAESILNPGGVLAVITFHSLEAKIVKQCFKRYEDPCICDKKAPICVCQKKPSSRIITKKALIASKEEMDDNPRSRSAQLRAIKKLDHVK